MAGSQSPCGLHPLDDVAGMLAALLAVGDKSQSPCGLHPLDDLRVEAAKAALKQVGHNRLAACIRLMTRFNEGHEPVRDIRGHNRLAACIRLMTSIIRRRIWTGSVVTIALRLASA